MAIDVKVLGIPVAVEISILPSISQTFFTLKLDCQCVQQLLTFL